jgi:hypothetical protein
MATVTSRVCDLGKDHKGDIEAHVFGADGEWFLADLCPDDAGKLTAALETFAKVGVPMAPKDALRAVGTSVPTYDPAVVRAWAQRKGKPVNDRGRVPGELVAEWRADTGN